MRKKINGLLAAAFIGCVVLVMVMTLITYGRNYAYGFFKSYKEQLPENPGLFDRLQARISKLDYNAENRLWGRDEMRYAAVGFQKLMPFKEVVSIGSASMVRLSSGGYYNLMEGELSEDKVNDILTFAEKAKEECGAETLFVYCHCALFEDGLLPGDTCLLDNNTAFADELLSRLERAGITVTDSRASYRRAGLTMDEAANKSDVHWTHLMALETAYDAAVKLNEAGFAADAQALSRSNFIDDLRPHLLAGEYARRVGIENVEPDDVHVLYPAYETCLSYEELNTGVSRVGSFREAVITEGNLAPDEGESYSSNAYYIYGHYLSQTHTHNERAPEGTVLIFKDSYGTPVSAFLGLAVRDVYAVDLRSTNKSMLDWTREIDPDVVIFAYSQQMLRDIEYVIED